MFSLQFNCGLTNSRTFGKGKLQIQPQFRSHWMSRLFPPTPFHCCTVMRWNVNTNCGDDQHLQRTQHGGHTYKQVVRLITICGCPPFVKSTNVQDRPRESGNEIRLKTMPAWCSQRSNGSTGTRHFVMQVVAGSCNWNSWTLKHAGKAYFRVKISSCDNMPALFHLLRAICFASSAGISMSGPMRESVGSSSHLTLRRRSQMARMENNLYFISQIGDLMVRCSTKCP